MGSSTLEDAKLKRSERRRREKENEDCEWKCRIKERSEKGRWNKERSSQELKQQRVTDPL